MKTYKGKKIHFAKAEYEQEYKDADTTLLFEYQGYCDDKDNLPHGTGKMTEIGAVRKGKKNLHEAPLNSREGEWINGDFYKGTYFMPPGRKNKGTFAYSAFYKVGDSELDGEGEELYYENEEDSENNKLLGYVKGTFRDGILIKGEIENASLINYSAMKGIKKIIYKGYVGWSKNIHGEKTEIQKGEIYYEDGFIYKGEIDSDLPHGKGVGVDKEGNSYSGIWFNGNLEGKTSSKKHPKQITKIAKGEATNKFFSIKSKNQKMPKYKIREKVKTEESIPRVNKSYTLTKTKIISGQQCQKKLWFDFHQPIKKDSFLFHLGKRFGDVVRNNYGAGIDLSNNIFDIEKAVKDTKDAINSKDTKVIYEAAFIFADTLVRTDVLVRNAETWELLEAKSSTKLKEEHIPDIAIQSFVVRANGINLSKIQLIHINHPKFTYQGDKNYKNLINEIEVTEEVRLREPEVLNHINNLKGLADKKNPCPDVDMGDHCKKPYDCDYQARCKALVPDSSITSWEILPNIPKELKNYCLKNNIKDLLKIPLELLKALKKRPNYINIQQAHRENTPWINPELKDIFSSFEFPFYFMDFETINQGVPIVAGTEPYYPLPFQWSVHKWNSINEEVKLKDGEFFLDFSNQGIERNFVESLLEAVGTKGVIFAHNASTETSVLKKLKEKDSCKDLAPRIDKLIERVKDTLSIVKENYYHPLMNGQYGIKKIAKAIPTSISYEEENNIEGGIGAQLAWFKCTDPKTSEEDKKKQSDLLKEYCAKDTMIIYDLVKHLMKESKK